MYCPKCKMIVSSRFCPECGSPTMANEPEPNNAGLNLNLGDANAISGGINITHSVVERQKSKEEIDLEHKNRYRALCRQYLLDGKIDSTERIMLDNLAGELGLTSDEQREILNSEIATSHTKSFELDKASKVVFMQITKKLKANDVNGVVTLLPKLQNAERNFEDYLVKFYYFLIVSVLRPSECLRRYESHTEDSYWLTYWSTMAYLVREDTNKAEQTKTKLSNWSEFDEENSLLLDIATSIKSGDYDTAEAFREVLEGSYSEELTDFAVALFAILNANGDALKIEYAPQQAFYLEGMFYVELGRDSLGVIQPDGTLGTSATSVVIPIVPVANISKPIIKEEDEEKKEMAMKSIVPIPFSKSKFEKLSKLPVSDGGFEAKELSEGLYILNRGELFNPVCGLWDEYLECLLLDFEYYSICDVADGVISYCKSDDDSTGYLCLKTKMRTINDYYGGGYALDSDSSLFLVQKSIRNNNYVNGLIDMTDGTYALKPEYQKIEESKYEVVKGYLHIQNENDQWGVFDCKNRKIVAPCKYKKLIKDPNNSFIWLLTDAGNYDNNPDVLFVPANTMYKRFTGGVMPHPLFENIFFIFKSKSEDDNGCAICNCNDHNIHTEFFDNVYYSWYDDDMDESQITPLVFVCKNDKWGLYDAESGNFVLNIEYDVQGDGIEGSPCYIFNKDNQEYTFNMFTRQFE